MPTIKMTTNIPVHASLKFADIVPGNFGPQVRLKGSFDGEDGMVFLPGKVWANLKALKSAGVIEARDYDEEPEKPLELPLLHRDVVLTRSQPAGAKYADLVVQTNGQTPTQTKPAFNSGPHVPGLDDDEPPHPAETYSQTRTPEPAPQGTSKLTQVERQYETTLTWVLDSVIPKLSKADIPVDASAVNAIVATCLIQASRAA